MGFSKSQSADFKIPRRERTVFKIPRRMRKFQNPTACARESG